MGTTIDQELVRHHNIWLFEDTPNGLAIVGEPLVDLLEEAIKSHAGAGRVGVKIAICSRTTTATTYWIAPTKAGESLPAVVSEEVLRLGGLANGSVTLGDNSGAGMVGADPPTGVVQVPTTTCRADCYQVPPRSSAC
ncbi:UNVERIFIED_CONTAM: hypothetical protein Sindi_0073300 [Sesamum indicum]